MTDPLTTYRLADDLELTRIGYGAMQLAGPGVLGPPRDRAEAVRVLRRVVELGITHLDTAQFYGPDVTNELVREALAPYPDGLRVVTKVGAVRDADGGWPSALRPEQLRKQVHRNLETLGLEALDVVNLRLGGGGEHGSLPRAGSLAEPFGALAELQREGLVRHLGLSAVTAEQLAEAQTIAPVVCVQNLYNLAHREDDALVDLTGQQGIAFVPFFPLGGFSPVQTGALDAVAARLGRRPLGVALAWLLQRSPNVLLIPGTSRVEHLEANVAAALEPLPADAVAELDAVESGVGA